MSLSLRASAFPQFLDMLLVHLLPSRRIVQLCRNLFDLDKYFKNYMCNTLSTDPRYVTNRTVHGQHCADCNTSFVGASGIILRPSRTRAVKCVILYSNLRKRCFSWAWNSQGNWFLSWVESSTSSACQQAMNRAGFCSVWQRDNGHQGAGYSAMRDVIYRVDE